MDILFEERKRKLCCQPSYHVNYVCLATAGEITNVSSVQRLLRYSIKEHFHHTHRSACVHRAKDTNFALFMKFAVTDVCNFKHVDNQGIFLKRTSPITSLFLRISLL